MTDVELGLFTATETGVLCSAADPSERSVGLAIRTALPCSVRPAVRSPDDIRRLDVPPDELATDDPADTTCNTKILFC